MSLVNDMLRDLDQRRKQSAGSAATSRLTPVAEVLPEKAERSTLIYMVLALIVAISGVIWFFMGEDDSQTVRQLEIVPNVVSNPAVDNVSTPATANSQGPVSQSPQNQVLETGTLDLQNTALTPQESISNNLRVASEQRTIAAATPDNRVSNSPANPQEPQPASSATAAIDESSSGIANTSNTVVETVDLSAAPAEEVKIESVLSPEERDLKAVQEALGLIANNDLASAYVVLEQQVVDNRYAHQSRETYAKLLLNEGNLLGAFELVEAGLALSPNHPGFKKIKARLLISQGELTEAVTLLIARAPEVSKDFEYHDILATAQLASRDYQGALISYTELIQHDQSQGKWWYGFAASQDLLGNTTAALQGYSQAVSISNLSANLRQRSQERMASLDR